MNRIRLSFFALTLLAPLSLAACDDPHANQQTSAMDNPMTTMAPAAGEDLEMRSGATAPAAPAPSIAVGEPHPDAPPAACPHQDLVGQTFDQTMADAITDRPVRVLYPDSPATMDYNPERINIILEKDTDRVTEVRCG